MTNKFFLNIFLFIVLASNICSQTRVSITGTVEDASGPVPGASIVLKGTTVGTATDSNGGFSINVPNPNNAILIVKFVGMREEVVELKGRTSGVNIVLQELTSQLDDVVVIGYGTERKGNIAAAMSSVSGEVLAKSPVANAAEALVGKMPGVQVTMADGSPDAQIMIRVRGGGL